MKIVILHFVVLLNPLRNDLLPALTVICRVGFLVTVGIDS
jgi:hypothetical protein